MRYSKGAASLLSSVFTFQAKPLVAANIFIPSGDHEAADGVALLAPSEDNADAGILLQDEPLRAIKLKQKCDELNIDCSMLGKKLHGRTGIDADTGLLAPADTAAKNGMDVAPSSWLASTTVSTCEQGFVDCVNGFVRGSNPAQTCFDACAGACCTYIDTDACERFTGKVCKDGSSCNGFQACNNANITSVVNSCKAFKACNKAAYKGGSIGNIVDSCDGKNACGYGAYEYGTIGSITGSCTVENACVSLGMNGGIVGSVTNSCNDKYSCVGAAFLGGSIGNIEGSCNGISTCYLLGGYGGTVGSLTNSCNATFSCAKGATFRGVIGNIANSCTTNSSCFSLGRGIGKVGHVTDSCTRENSCKKAGSNRGSIGSISASCNADAACNSTGSGSAGAITSNLMGCCNTPSVCQSANQTTLPKECSSKVR